MLKRLKFEIEIAASTEKVWKFLWEPSSYSQWTGCFCAGSYYETKDLTIGNRIHFLTPNGEGMYSNITGLTSNSYMEFTHLGNIVAFKEQQMDVSNNEYWEHAKEIYELKNHGAHTHLSVYVDVIDKYESYMTEMFPKALHELKRIVEL